MKSTDPKNKLRAGLSACGGISHWTMDMAQASEDFEVTAIQDVDENTLVKFGNRYGISRQHRDFEDLLTQDIDFIIINSPNHLHLEHVTQASAAGKPCLIQKPMTRNLEEARSMVQVVENNKVKAGLVLEEIGKPVNQQIRLMLQAGLIGQPCLIHTCYAHDIYVKKPLAENSWRRDPAKVGGAAFIQLAVHHINLISWMLQSTVTEVSALGRQNHTIFEDETTVAVAAFANGVLASFSASFTTEGEFITIQGTQGYIHLFSNHIAIKGNSDYEGELFNYSKPNESIIELASLEEKIRQNQPRYEIHGKFARWILHNEPYPCPLAMGLADMKVLDAVYQSKRTKEAVPIDQFTQVD